MGIIGFSGLGVVIKVCPWTVFGGFVAGTGAQLIEFALNMMYPNFASFATFGLHGVQALLCVDACKFCCPGVLVALGVFFVPRIRPGDYTFLLPLSVLGLVIGFYLTLLATNTSVVEA